MLGSSILYVMLCHVLQAAVWQGLAAAHQVVALGYDVILTDIDTVWFNDPVPYLETHADVADVVAASDAVATANEAGDAGLELQPGLVRELITSVMFVRSTEGKGCS